MLSPVQVVLNFFVVFLLPLVVVSLIRRPRLPDSMILGRLYRADPHLSLVSDLFLLSLCLTCLANLADHFGLVSASTGETLKRTAEIPFLTLLAVFLFMLARAGLRLRRQNQQKT